MLYLTPARATLGTVPPHYIEVDTTWTAGQSPILIDGFVIVNPDVTLTIEAGVEVDSANILGPDYSFEVNGTLLALGTAADPILFHNTVGAWNGISILGTDTELNLGSTLEYVVLDAGGAQGSSAGANLTLYRAQADVRHCQFKNSTGDGILAGTQAVPNVYDSSFTGNEGYAVNLLDGSVNPVFSNLIASGNGASLPYGGDLVFVNDATLHGAHTWESMGLPYLILSTIVGSDAVLTIEPGVQVLAAPGNDALDVQGTLIANGTPAQGIRFEPADPALGWSGIALWGTDVLPSIGNQLGYVTISQGGYTAGYCGLYLAYSGASVSHSRFEGSGTSGVCLDQASSLTLSNVELTGNQAYGLDIMDAGSMFTLDNVSAWDNGHDTIGVEGGVITGDRAWPNAGIDTYDLFGGSVTIAPEGSLTLAPGLTILFSTTRDIMVQGDLVAVGTAAEPILFTGSTPTPGLWAGLNFIGTPERFATGRFSYATLEYGGYGGSALVSAYYADLTFDHCTLRHSTGGGVDILPVRSQVSAAAGAPAQAPVQITWSNLYTLGPHAIDNSQAEPVMATHNWWGDASGPAHEDNPGGTGSAIYGPAVYRPFLSGPVYATVFVPFVVR